MATAPVDVSTHRDLLALSTNHLPIQPQFVSKLVSKQRDLLALSRNRLSNQPRLVSLPANHFKGVDANSYKLTGGSRMEFDSGNGYFDSGKLQTRENGGSVHIQTSCLTEDILLAPPDIFYW